MERCRLEYWIDIGLLISFFIVAITSLVIFFAFVSISPGIGRTITFLGTTKATWIPWHNYAGLVMIFLVLIHLILHFRWLIEMTKRMFVKTESFGNKK